MLSVTARIPRGMVSVAIKFSAPTLLQDATYLLREGVGGSPAGRPSKTVRAEGR